jgi:hypothetical protein
LRSLIRDYLLPLAVIHGLVTVGTPGPVQNTYSTEQLQVQDYWDRIIAIGTTLIKFVSSFLDTPFFQPKTMARPCAQHVQSTRRMSLTVKRPSTKGWPLQLEGACTWAATMPQPSTLRLILNAAALAAASPTLLFSDW